MTTSILLFYVFATVIVVFALMSVITRRILRAAVYLLFVLVATAGLYYLLEYHFLAAMQLALYAGGIVVLIIFSVLLTHHIDHKFKRPTVGNVMLGGGIALIGSALAIFTLVTHPFQASGEKPVKVTVEIIGKSLLETGKNGYALPFEVISILLLAALIAAIIIAKKGK